MLNVILGESMEHKRLFEQAAAGFEDLLGRRTDGAERVGGVAAVALDGVARRASRIALGSNLGDREAHLRGAIAALAPILSHLSRLRRSTKPSRLASIGAAADVPQLPRRQASRCSRRPRFSTCCSAIEQRFGRERPHAGAPRTLDLDLILYGDGVIKTEGLIGAASAIPRAAVRARAARRDRR